MKKQNNIAKKLLSYSAVAGAFLAYSPDVAAQCGTADAANPILPVDIDGDGNPDININFVEGNSYLGYISSTYQVGSIMGTIPYTYNFTFTFGTVGTAFGCTTGNLAGGTTGVQGMGGFPPFGPQVYGPVYAPCDYTVAGLQYLSFIGVSSVYNAAFATPIGSNQLIGQTAGDSVCGPLGSGYVAGGTNTFATLALNQSLCYIGGTYYLLYTMFNQACPPVPSVGSYVQTIVGETCTDSFGTIYYGATQMLTYAVGSFYTNTTGTFLAASGSIPSLGCAPYATVTGSNFIGVQFDGQDGTHYGWVEVAINPDGSITCVSTGYNGCSVEEVTAAGAAANAVCIAAGDATLNTANEACSIGVCTLANLGLSAGACDDAGTTAPDNSADGDDTFVLTINPTGTDLGTTYTISGGATGTGMYGTPFTVTLPADGSTISITVTDDMDTACTLTTDITAPAPCSLDIPPADIPTLSQWGLIALSLMLMSYGAIAMSNFGELAAILRRKEE